MTDQTQIQEPLLPVTRLSKDLRNAAASLTDKQARYFVDAYYQMQDDRKRSASRADKMEDTGEPHELIDWLKTQSHTLEKQIHTALGRYANAHPLGIWMQEIDGIGPVISAGFLSALNLLPPEKTNTVGKFWALCGQAPGQRRIRGQKLNYNPSLKQLCFHVGECFKRVSGNKSALYGQIYQQAKARQVQLNELGKFADQAKISLEGKKWRADSPALPYLKAGKLPPGHLDRRACRIAAKMFLSHLHEVWYEYTTGEKPPAAFAFAVLKHAGTSYVPPPGKMPKRKPITS